MNDLWFFLLAAPALRIAPVDALAGGARRCGFMDK
jgi:hypothetical protein